MVTVMVMGMGSWWWVPPVQVLATVRVPPRVPVRELSVPLV